jgi:hypothetical protein
VASIQNHRDGHKCVIEMGEDVVGKMGWTRGETRLDVFVGDGDDVGLIRLQEGGDFKLRKAIKTPGARLIFRAAAMGASHCAKIRRVHWEKDANNRLYINLTSLLKEGS